MCFVFLVVEWMYNSLATVSAHTVQIIHAFHKLLSAVEVQQSVAQQSQVD